MTELEENHRANASEFQWEKRKQVEEKIYTYVEEYYGGDLERFLEEEEYGSIEDAANDWP